MLERFQIRQWLLALLFPAVVVYYELVFKLSTVQGLFQEGTLYLLLFSAAYGLLCYLLCTISSRRWLNWLLTLAYILLTAIPFLVEYFVYRQFKVFYDLNTMFAGAGDALSEYTQALYALLTSTGGMIFIVLMLLPGAVYLLVGWLFAIPRRLRWPHRLGAAALTVGLFLLALLGIDNSPTLSLQYGPEYNYQTSVSRFGLLTSVRLDIREYFRADSGGFESIGTLPPVTEPSATAGTGEAMLPNETTVPTEPPSIEYGYNQMDIDFASLSASGTKKELNSYVETLTPSTKNAYTGLFQGKNLIFITAEAFSAEVIDPELTPTLYRLATKGIQFTDYYQPASAGTTGGEYQNVFGLMPTYAGASFKKTANYLNYFTMGNQLNRLGYYGAAFHNNSYTYYDRHKTHNNLGYSAGFMGYGNGIEKFVSRNWPQSDLEMLEGTLETYIHQQPFNIYYMTVSGHSNYMPNTGSNDMVDKNWSRVEHLPYSKQVRGYLAANLELEDALAHLVIRLEEEGIADDTVICIATDHFPYGLDNDAPPGNMPYLSELYGYEVVNYIQRDHSRLILWCGSLEDEPPIVVDTPTFSLDILPTLSNLFGTEFDSRLMPGRDVFSDAPALVFNMNYDWKTELGTYLAGTGKFTPVNDQVQIPEGYVDTVKATVRNKIRYCEGVLATDYFRYLFG